MSIPLVQRIVSFAKGDIVSASRLALVTRAWSETLLDYNLPILAQFCLNNPLSYVRVFFDVCAHGPSSLAAQMVDAYDKLVAPGRASATAVETAVAAAAAAGNEAPSVPAAVATGAVRFASCDIMKREERSECRTALHVAASRGSAELAEVLLQRGWSPSTPDAHGKRAVAVAERHADAQLTALLQPEA